MKKTGIRITLRSVLPGSTVFIFNFLPIGNINVIPPSPTKINNHLKSNTKAYFIITHLKGVLRTLFSALYQHSPTLPIILVQVAAKHFLHNPRLCHLNIENKCPAPQYWSNTCELISISTQNSFRSTIPFKVLSSKK
jgi:hypothetical protein